MLKITLVFLLNLIGIVKLLQFDVQTGYFKPPKYITDSNFNDTFMCNGVVQQKVDHFNNDSQKTFEMRYYSNSEYYDGAGPMYVFIGGFMNIDVLTPLLSSGLMHSMAIENNGCMFLIEHRYFGKSLPVVSLQTSKMRFLTIEQSLEDILNFIQTKKDHFGAKNNKVVLIGAGHGAALASWMRLKYPEVVNAVVSDSGVVNAEFEAFDFIQNGLQAFRNIPCREELQNSLFSILDSIQTVEGQTQIDKDFTFCSTMNFTNSLDNQAVFFQLVEILTHDILNGSKSLLHDCTQIRNRKALPEYDIFVKFIESKKICIKNYKELLVVYRTVTPSFETELRSLLYQKCTQLGGFIVLSQNIDILNVDFYYQLCSDVFGIKFTPSYINSMINKTNSIYGGLQGNFTNVVVVKGCLDPYKSLMIDKSNYLRPVVIVNGTSHQGEVVDISKKTDTYNLKSIRKSIRKVISSWIIS